MDVNLVNKGNPYGNALSARLVLKSKCVRRTYLDLKRVYVDNVDSEIRVSEDVTDLIRGENVMLMLLILYQGKTAAPSSFPSSLSSSCESLENNSVLEDGHSADYDNVEEPSSENVESMTQTQITGGWRVRGGHMQRERLRAYGRGSDRVYRLLAGAVHWACTSADVGLG